MENRTNRPTNVGDINSLKEKIKTQSAEDKLKKSMKTLSYTGGGTGGSTPIRVTNRPTSTQNTSKEDRKKVGGVVLDVETIQGASKQKFETRGRRNNVIILVLVLALVVSLVFLAITIVDFQKSKKPPNLRYSMQGAAAQACEWSIAGGNKTKFVLPKGLSAGLRYDLSSSLKINTAADVNIIIEVIVLLEGEPIVVNLAYNIDHTQTFERLSNSVENKFQYREGVYSGVGTLLVCDGIDFTDTPHNLSSENIEIEVIAYIEYV